MNIKNLPATIDAAARPWLLLRRDDKPNRFDSVVDEVAADCDDQDRDDYSAAVESAKAG